MWLQKLFNLFSSCSSSSSSSSSSFSSSSLWMLDLEGFMKERVGLRQRVQSFEWTSPFPSDAHSKHQHHPLTPALPDIDDNRSHSGILYNSQGSGEKARTVTPGEWKNGWEEDKRGWGSTTCPLYITNNLTSSLRCDWRALKVFNPVWVFGCLYVLWSLGLIHLFSCEVTMTINVCIMKLRKCRCCVHMCLSEWECVCASVSVWVCEGGGGGGGLA